jgi:hypothetical protein
MTDKSSAHKLLHKIGYSDNDIKKYSEESDRLLEGIPTSLLLEMNKLATKEEKLTEIESKRLVEIRVLITPALPNKSG